MCSSDLNYFNGAPSEIVELAREEVLQFLLEEVDGNIGPLITTSFWGNKTDTFSNDTFEQIKIHGGFLLERQSLDVEDAFNSWKEYYEMEESEYNLLRDIYKRKIEQPDQLLILSKEEISIIGANSEEGLIESKTSFDEIRIGWEK